MWNFKETFEISHKISYPYIERCNFYTTLKFQELLDLWAHKCFWKAPQHHGNLSRFNGVALYKDRVIIPQLLHAQILEAQHSVHKGVTHMCSKDEASIFWPGMTPSIVGTRDRCTACNHMAPSQPHAPPTPPVPLMYPFQYIARLLHIPRAQLPGHCRLLQ